MLQTCSYLLLCFSISSQNEQILERLLPEIRSLAKCLYSKISPFQTEKKKAIKVIYGLENSAISTCSSLHRRSSVECILLLKLSWRYWECWLTAKETSEWSSSASHRCEHRTCRERAEDLLFSSWLPTDLTVILYFPWHYVQTRGIYPKGFSYLTWGCTELGCTW